VIDSGIRRNAVRNVKQSTGMDRANIEDQTDVPMEVEYKLGVSAVETERRKSGTGDARAGVESDRVVAKKGLGHRTIGGSRYPSGEQSRTKEQAIRFQTDNSY
jgi:hypothetical protein